MNSPRILNIPKIALLATAMLLSITGYGQKDRSFKGMLEYKISVRDTSLRNFAPDNIMIIYSNDTISRQENFTQHLGKQVTIRHMEKNKSYLLLNSPAGKFAIQTDLSENQSDTARVSKYTFKKKWFKRKIMGMKAKRLEASHPDFDEAIEFLYIKGIDAKYNSAFEDIPGLPVKYSVVTPDAIYDYELVKINRYNPDRDLFGVPSDYERISFDDFLNKMLESKGSSVVPE